MENAAEDGPGFAAVDATRALPVIRGRKPGSIKYAHTGVAGGADVGRDRMAGASSVPGLGNLGLGDVAGALPVTSAARVRLTERIRRAGSIRLTERIRLTGRGCPPEIAHE